MSSASWKSTGHADFKSEEHFPLFSPCAFIYASWVMLLGQSGLLLSPDHWLDHQYWLHTHIPFHSVQGPALGR